LQKEKQEFESSELFLLMPRSTGVLVATAMNPEREEKTKHREESLTLHIAEKFDRQQLHFFAND
jgi:hypothetical protein